MNQRVARLRPMEGLSARHLMLAVEEPIRVWNAAITGTTVAHLGKGHLEQVGVVVPSAEILSQVSKVFDDFANDELVLIRQSRVLTSMRDFLLPKLLTGQIDVSSLDLDALVEDSVA